HQYFASLTPSEKNQYTGMFEGKNLILLTAEAFSPAAIDKDLTPTLYRLTHEGVVCKNFYQPDWTMSTTGGEFSVTTGLIPNWHNGGKDASPALSVNNAMPTTLAHLFAAKGYSVPAWHNHTYTYYGRNEYLVNFGYDYKAKDNGMELAHPNTWPESDLEMMEATADSYINDYVNNGKPFHAYYMTVSGHGYYTWAGNAMSRKHRDEVEARYPDLSETSQAYLACNMELDLALEYLVDKLEAAGIADDTLIVMTADHYPYLMVTEDGDFYNELRGFEDTDLLTSRYRNTLLMWSGAFQETVEVDIPCSSIDIVPTICNLFGLDYDSRLYSGRDIFATNYQADQYSNCMPLVVFANNRGKGNSWITAAGTYECSTGEFTPNEGITVDDDYVGRVKRLVAAKVNYSKLILQEDYYKYVFPDGQ
ncbi:MAG: LTA synthase family protein, partial [Oscillospiraceae bacterium]|nr:LTA synthase family protein [Oscillospiraceae bacterium]